MLACAAMCPVHADPSVSLSVNGQPVAGVDAHFSLDPSGFWTGSFSAAANGWSVSTGTLFLAADMTGQSFLDYDFEAQAGSTPTSFLFTLLLPFTGRYDTLTSGHSGSITDGGTVVFADASLGVAQPAFAFVHNPLLGGSVLNDGAISTGCLLQGPLAFSAHCDGGDLSATLPQAVSGGRLGVSVAFVLSAHDKYSTAGSVGLSEVNAVPEPGPAAVMIGGLAAMLAAVKRRRIR
jgi:hypothetical protein